MDENLTKVRHERSKKDFPKLKLEKDEYIEVVVSRAKICLLLIWAGVLLSIIVFAIVFLIFSFSVGEVNEMGKNFMRMLFFILSAVVIIAGIFTTIVFRHNNMFITNKRITQTIMLSPVATSVNIIDLSSIEDVSFRQDNLIQKLFGFGTLRLATVGDETTYTFPLTNVTSEEIATIVRLVNDDRDHKN